MDLLYGSRQNVNPSFVAHADDSDAEVDGEVKIDDDDHKSVGTFEGGGVGYHGEDINSEDDDGNPYNGVCDLKGIDLDNAINRCLHPEVYVHENIAAPIVSFVSTLGPDIISTALPVSEHVLLPLSATSDLIPKTKKTQVPPKPVVDLNLQILAETTVENNDDIGKLKVRQ